MFKCLWLPKLKKKKLININEGYLLTLLTPTVMVPACHYLSMITILLLLIVDLENLAHTCTVIIRFGCINWLKF